MKLITRKEAKAKGLTRYFTGEACTRRHVFYRFTSDCHCVLCHKLYLKKWVKANLSVYRAAISKWRRQNRLKNNVYNNVRRTKIKDNGGQFTEANIIAIYQKQRGLCAAGHCAKQLNQKFHIDHKRPVARGGTSWPRNLQLLCAACNSSKGSKTMREWLRALAS